MHKTAGWGYMAALPRALLMPHPQQARGRCEAPLWSIESIFLSSLGACGLEQADGEGAAVAQAGFKPADGAAGVAEAGLQRVQDSNPLFTAWICCLGFIAWEEGCILADSPHCSHSPQADMCYAVSERRQARCTMQPHPRHV